MRPSASAHAATRDICTIARARIWTAGSWKRISALSSIIPAVKGHAPCPRSKMTYLYKIDTPAKRTQFRRQTVASGTELRPALGRPGGRAESCDGRYSEIFRAPIPRQAEDARVQGRCASEPEAWQLARPAFLIAAALRQSPATVLVPMPFCRQRAASPQAVVETLAASFITPRNPSAQ